MEYKKIFRITVLWLAGWICMGCMGCGGENAPQNDEQAGEMPVKHELPTKQDVLTYIRNSADIVTTEVTVRKIALYDTSKSERFSWKNPSTWKYGDRKCVIPVEVHIKYGYDLSELSIDHVLLTKDSTAIVVVLPSPKIIDANYNTYIDEGTVVSISTGLRSEIGHALEEEIRRKGYEAVLKEDLTSVIGEDVRQNAKVLLGSMISSLGFDSVRILDMSDLGKEPEEPMLLHRRPYIR
ncbi:MAG: DUF4230 domain-containing protein [Bacteroides sp.]|nr:DUF4230 domain-containing protein [Bacteroides sp.]MCM1420135.1 DUF4230 domain-containing protein [Bacteroides sp.]